jgi:acetoacetyl-CoA synthetase
MMWNYLVSGLVLGSSIVLFDGDPAYPDSLALWRLMADEQVTVAGVSPRFLSTNRRSGMRPVEAADLSVLRTVGSTGAPLDLETYEWFYDAVSPTAALVSASGGTDVLSGLVGGASIVPVYAGQISCAALGVDADVIDSEGRSIRNTAGELVVRQPMPSMPLGFWNDTGGSRMYDAYFATNPGLWTHGDWATATPDGRFVISGRSDATLNRGGVRMGTAELYSVIEQIPGVLDSVAVCIEGDEGDDDLLLVFVVVTSRPLSDIAAEVERELRRQLSPRHAPDRVLAIDEIPRTSSGKKSELTVKRLIQGRGLDHRSLDSVTVSREVIRYLTETGASLRRQH